MPVQGVVVLRKIFILYISFFLFACMPGGKKPLDIYPTEHEYQHVALPTDGSVNLFIYYPQSLATDYDDTFAVYVDNELMASLRNKTYTMINVHPGKHTVNVKELDMSGEYELGKNLNYYLRIDHKTQQKTEMDMTALVLYGAPVQNLKKSTISAEFILEKDDANSEIRRARYIAPVAQQISCPEEYAYVSSGPINEDESFGPKTIPEHAQEINHLGDADCELACVAVLNATTSDENDIMPLKVRAHEMGAGYIQITAMNRRYASRTYDVYARALKCKR
jgi:hypothetical protein